MRDEAALERFSVDESGLGRYAPECAVLPETSDEVALVLEVAQAHAIPVTPRGTGTGMTGGALPVKGGIVLCTERMTKIKELDPDELIAVVEPGVITGDLQARAEELGVFYPPDPASLASCSLGGNVAENAGGPRAFKYGTTREYVLGLDVALMGGERFSCGRRTPKGVTGYDVTAAIVGSEGTFAVATAVTLRLLPRPAAAGTLIATFADAITAGAAVSAILHRGLRPRALELLDRSTVEHMRNRGRRLPPDAKALLLVEVDGPAESIDAEVERAGAGCEQAGAIEIVVARSEEERRNLWETRRLVNPTLRDTHRRKIPEDIVVPRKAIPEMLRRVDAISAETNIPTATYGHAGDGNLHVNLLVDEPDDVVGDRLSRAMDAIMRATLDLGGTLAGEHGVGLLKMKYMTWEQSPPLLRLQRRMKQVFDPRDLLNPGKILPGERVTSEDLAAALAARSREAIELPGFAPSAVLALLLVDELDHLERARLVFTVRRADLRTHAGQISFPGGRRDDSDADLAATALRETHEELGVPLGRVRVLGILDDVPTPAKYIITPVVGVARTPLPLVPNDAEVAEVFECALPVLREPGRYTDAGTRSWQGVAYSLHEYQFEKHRIWGATARMVHQLLEIVSPLEKQKARPDSE